MNSSKTEAVNSKLQEFFVTGLQEIYWSEVHLVDVLTTMQQAATSQELKDAFDVHARQTREHAEKVEQAFAMLALTAEQKQSIGLQGLFDEGWHVIDETQEGSAQRDVALIIAAQKVEHYEIACYGSLITLAQTLGHMEIAQLLKGTLGEEKETDALLSELAESGVNEEASEEPLEMESK